MTTCFRPIIWTGIAIVAFFGGLARDAAAFSEAQYEQDPVRYSSAELSDPVSQLWKAIDTGKVTLAIDEKQGLLKSFLKALDIPESSQVLVFSKTSFQRELISPRTPRAIYFNDEVYVGRVPHSDLIEVSSVDPHKGAIFYSFEGTRDGLPRLQRHTHECLQCHDSSMCLGGPGHLVRSVYSDRRGLPILSAGTFVTTPESPLRERWGGWYVTGKHGSQTHMGNLTIAGHDEQEHPERIDLTASGNLTNLSSRFDTSLHLTPHSDIVALMVLEHQTHLHNLLTRANHLARFALRDEVVFNRALGRPEGERSAGVLSRLKNAGEPLVKALLCSGETRLTERVAGTSNFARDFSARGPRDERGRSLREFDLEKRLFRYPCSYLIYSASFDALPEPLRDYVYRRLWEVLTGADTSEAFAHLSVADRRALLEILRDTKRGLPEFWKVP